MDVVGQRWIDRTVRSIFRADGLIAVSKSLHILIKPNATLRDVVELCMNGDISYADAREWCMENDISLGQFDRWLYGALRKSDTPVRVEPKEPWPYRVVAGINRVLEILLNSILEDFI